MTAFAIRSRAGSPTWQSATTASETCSLIISQYCAAIRHQFHADVPLGNLPQPGGLIQGTDISRAAHRNIPGPPGSGGASTAPPRSPAWRSPSTGFPGPGPSRRAHTSARLEHPRELGGRLGDVGKNMYPNRTELLPNAASPNGRSSALHTVVSNFVIPCAAACRAAMSSISAASSFRTTCPPGASLATVSRLTSARSDVEMPLIIGDVKTLDNRCADRAQLIHDDRVPLPQPAESPGQSPAERPGSHRRWHRPSRYRMHPPTRRHPLTRVHNARFVRHADHGSAHGRRSPVPRIALDPCAMAAQFRWGPSSGR